MPTSAGPQLMQSQSMTPMPMMTNMNNMNMGMINQVRHLSIRLSSFCPLSPILPPTCHLPITYLSLVTCHVRSYSILSGTFSSILFNLIWSYFFFSFFFMTSVPYRTVPYVHYSSRGTWWVQWWTITAATPSNMYARRTYSPLFWTF